MRALLAFVLLLSAAFPLFSQNEIALLASEHGGGDFSVALGPDPELDSSSGFALMVSLDRGETRRLDFVYARQEGALSLEDLSQPPDEAFFGIDIDYLQIGGRVLFQPRARIVPYLAMTIGATRFAPKQGDDTIRASGALGGGVDLVIVPSVALRLDGRWYATLTGGDVQLSSGGGEFVGIGQGNGFNQFAASAGLVVRLP